MSASGREWLIFVKLILEARSFVAESSPTLAELFPNTLLGKSRPRLDEESATKVDEVINTVVPELRPENQNGGPLLFDVDCCLTRTDSY